MKRFVTPLAVLCTCLFLACGGSSNNNTSSSNGNTAAPSGSQPGGGSSGGSSSDGGSGSGSGSGGTTTGASATAAIAYIGGSNNDVNGVRVDGSNNVGSTSGSPYAVGGAVQDMAMNDGLLYVDWYVSTQPNYHLTAFKADANGALTQLGTVSVGGLTIGFDPSGTMLYVGTLNGFEGYKVDRGTGALSPLPGSPYSHPAFEGMAYPTVSPDGTHLCAHNNGPRVSDTLNCLARHTDGSLDRSGETDPLGGQFGLPFFVIPSDSTYVVATDGDQVEINAIASSTLASAAKVSSGGQHSMGVATTGQWIAVANQGSNTVSMFAVNSAGQLMLSGTPESTAGAPFRLAFSHDGSYLFVSSDRGMSVFQFNTKTGILSPLNGGKSLPGTNRAVTAQ